MPFDTLESEAEPSNEGLRVIAPGRPLLFEPDYERRTIESVKRYLDDDLDCAKADYSIRWVKTPAGPMPLLVIAFNLPNTLHQPALAVALVAAQKGTLLEVLPGNNIIEGERLRNLVLRSVDNHLSVNGLRLPAEG